MRTPDSVQYSRPGQPAAARSAAPAAARGLRRRPGQPGRPPCPVRASSPGGLTGPRRAALIEEVERSGLTGRGGAGFPTARKLAAVAAGHAPVVVANGTEGEPASAKDKILLARSPHLVLDGVALAAELVGARQAVIVVHFSVREIVDEAIAERRRARAGPDPDPGRDSCRPVRGRRGQRCRALDRAWCPHPHRDTAAAVDARPGRKADAGAERRDPGPPGAHRPLRRRLVPLRRHRRRTWHHAGHRPGGRARALCPRNSHRHPGRARSSAWPAARQRRFRRC